MVSRSFLCLCDLSDVHLRRHWILYSDSLLWENLVQFCEGQVRWVCGGNGDGDGMALPQVLTHSRIPDILHTIPSPSPSSLHKRIQATDLLCRCVCVCVCDSYDHGITTIAAILELYFVAHRYPKESRVVKIQAGIGLFLGVLYIIWNFICHYENGFWYDILVFAIRFPLSISTLVMEMSMEMD